MALFVKQDEERSQLQQKIAADMAERQRARDLETAAMTDGVDDSKYIEGTSRLSRSGIIIAIVVAVIVIALIIFVVTR